MLTQLARHSANEARNERTAQVNNLFIERAPAASQEHAITRAEEARALYTLRAFGLSGSNELMRQRGFSEPERAAALDTVGGRLAQDYRTRLGQLKAFAALEQERDNLARAAAEYRDQQGATPEFQSGLANLRAQESNGPQPALRRELAALLVNPELEREQAANAQQISQTARSLSRLAGAEITTSQEARNALAPDLRRQRAALDELAAERAEVATDPMSVDFSDLYIALKPRDQWQTKDKTELVEKMAQALAARVPNATASFSQPIELRVAELISGVRSDVAIKLYGDDLEVLKEKRTKSLNPSKL